MPNRLSQAFDRAADVLNDYWSEQNEHGDLIPVAYRPIATDATEPIEWQAVMGEKRFEPVFDERAQHTSVRELWEADIRTPLVVAAGVASFQSDASFEIAGEVWRLDEANCVWDSEFVTFGLMREPLTRMNELRRAPV